MKINLVEREFVYHGTTLADPNPKFSIEEVRSFYATQFPERPTPPSPALKPLASGFVTASSAPSDRRADGMQDTNKQSLLQEVRESEGRQASANPLTGLMLRMLECKDSQEASSALARALSLQGSGDPVSPGSGIWPIPPA
jgi:PRTRC genetic system protein C